MGKSKSPELDKVNNKRVEEAKLRVAHAIRLLNNPIACMQEDRKINTACTDISHAVNLLESASQDMKWACSYFDWNPDVIDQIDDACARLGRVLAFLVDEKNDEEYDVTFAGCDGAEALAMLGKALATLIRWFDDDQDVSEI